MFTIKGCSLIRGVHYERFHCSLKVSIMSPRARLYTRVGNFKIFSLRVGKVLHARKLLLKWLFSALFQPLLYAFYLYGDHIHEAYSKWDLTKLLYRGTKFTPFSDTNDLLILALPCLGPLAPRRAVGARHDGLPRQFSPLLPVVCHGLSLSEGFAGPFRDVVDPALFRPASSSTAFDCSL